MSHATTPEPPPKNTKGEDVWPLVIHDVRTWACAPDNHPDFDTWIALAADMQARLEEGVRRYGVPLQTRNGRNARVDLYQEVLDACAYARQVAMEAMRTDDWEVYNRLLGLAHRLRKRMVVTT